MNFFTENLQLLIIWIQHNPHWALLITFVISLCESLAVIGTMIPGSFTMTAIGILAGSGVMRIDLTILSAIMGAVAGDSLSYCLGYFFRDHLAEIWPFKRYPHWLTYGKNYFTAHGGKSVLIGRFFGPLRSIIPVIAGMMNMRLWQFFIANVLSAIAWSMLYIMPGVLIGAIGSELSTKDATKSLLFLLLIIVCAWFLIILLKRIWQHSNNLIRQKLRSAWQKALLSPATNKLCYFLTPKNETDNFASIACLLLLCCSTLLVIILTALVMQENLSAHINQTVYVFLHNIRNTPLDLIAHVISAFINTPTILSLTCAIGFFCFYYREQRLAMYCLLLIITCLFVTMLFAHSITVPDLQQHKMHYPDINMTLFTALLCFMRSYIATCNVSIIVMRVTRTSVIILLLLIGLSNIYLGNNWLISLLGAYSIGIMIYCLFWLFYRRLLHPITLKKIPNIICIGIFLAGFVISIINEYQALQHISIKASNEYILTHNNWWDPKELLPSIYTTNSLGKHIGILNIQYAGDPHVLQKTLQLYGWKKPSSSLMYMLLKHTPTNSVTADYPLMQPLYLNQKPQLTLIYRQNKNQPFCIMHLWPSHYHLQNQDTSIWLGSIYIYKTQKFTPSFKYLTSALTTKFKFNIEELTTHSSSLHHATPVKIIMIQAA